MPTPHAHPADATNRPGHEPTGDHRPPGRLRALWSGFVGAIGGVLGLAPHLLHHIGPLAGTALVAGAGGTALFAALGLLASIPLLIRLKRRYHTWWAPAAALAAFIILFALSTFVIGPLISGDASTPSVPEPASSDHPTHHSD